MRYTLAEGVDKHEQDVHRRLLVSIPIIVALLFLALLGARPTKQQPVVGPAYTSINTPSTNSAAKNTAKSTKPKTTKVAAAATAPVVASTINPQGNNSAAVGSGGSGGPAPVVGGRGGGGSSTPSTIACVDEITHTQQLCYSPYRTCTLPVGVTAVGKPVLAVSGTCIVIN